jgi:hypothetical protein
MSLGWCFAHGSPPASLHSIGQVGEKIAPIDLSQEAVTSFNGATILSDDDLDSVYVCVCVFYIKKHLWPHKYPKQNSLKKRKKKRFHHPFLRL